MFSGVYELPFSLGKPFLGNASGPVNQLAGGLEVVATALNQSGFPFQETAGRLLIRDSSSGGGDPRGDGLVEVLKTRVSYRLIDPGSEWRLHREWYQRSAMGELLGRAGEAIELQRSEERRVGKECRS